MPPVTLISLASSVVPACSGSLKAIVIGKGPPVREGAPAIVATGPVVSTVNVPFGKMYAPPLAASTVISDLPGTGTIVSVHTLLAVSGVRLSTYPLVTLRSAPVRVIDFVEVNVTVKDVSPRTSLSGVRVSGGAALRTILTISCSARSFLLATASADTPVSLPGVTPPPDIVPTVLAACSGTCINTLLIFPLTVIVVVYTLPRSVDRKLEAAAPSGITSSLLSAANNRISSTSKPVTRVFASASSVS